MNELEHRIPKQERILAVVEPPRHFVKVGRFLAETRRQTPIILYRVPPRLAALEMCDGASVPISAT